MNFSKFPRTPHLFLLPGVQVRDDKIMSAEEVVHFLADPVTVEEKVDGANIGLSFNESGQLKIQNRGGYIEPGFSEQFNPLWDWAYQRLSVLQEHVGKKYILFGEWCYVKHSIHYTQLPDYFIGFDMYDKQSGTFLNTHDRNHFFDQMNIARVPQIGRKRYQLNELTEMLSSVLSSFYNGPMEGIYLRNENDNRLISRAKLVRREFVDQISEHWSKKRMVKNLLYSNTIYTKP